MAAIRVRLLVAAAVIVRCLPIGARRRRDLNRRLAVHAYRLALSDLFAQMSRKAGRG